MKVRSRFPQDPLEDTVKGESRRLIQCQGSRDLFIFVYYLLLLVFTLSHQFAEEEISTPWSHTRFDRINPKQLQRLFVPLR